MTSLTLAAVVMTLSGVPRPSQIRWCLLPVFRRSTGDGPVSAPPFSRGCVNRPHTHVTSRVRQPRSARRAGPGATGRRLLPPATAPVGASTSAPSRTPAPAAGVARLCRCTGRTGCPGGRAGPAPASAPETAPATAAATARPEPTTHRPRSTVGYPHLHERPNHHTGNGQPGRFSKIVLRALSGPCRLRSVQLRGRRFERRIPSTGCSVLPVRRGSRFGIAHGRRDFPFWSGSQRGSMSIYTSVPLELAQWWIFGRASVEGFVVCPSFITLANRPRRVAGRVVPGAQ